MVVSVTLSFIHFAIVRQSIYIYIYISTSQHDQDVTEGFF